MAKVEELIDELDTLGVKLELEDGKINFTPKSKVTPEMLSRMKEHRDELMTCLADGEVNRQKSQKDTVGNGDRKEGPEGLGGWLIFIGIGIFLAPFRTANALLQSFSLFSDGSWEAVTTPGSELYDSLWAPLIIFELVGNVLFLCFYAILIILFFRKSQWFPKAWIAVTLIIVIAGVLAASLSSSISGNPPFSETVETPVVVRTFVGIAIWVPYMLVSKRVKNTFVK